MPTPQQAPPAGPSSPPSTAGTHKTLWPAQLHQILATRLLSGKTPLKLLQRPRVVLHSPACYMLGSRESSAYPDQSNLDGMHQGFGQVFQSRFPAAFLVNGETLFHFVFGRLVAALHKLNCLGFFVLFMDFETPLVYPSVSRG